MCLVQKSSSIYILSFYCTYMCILIVIPIQEFLINYIRILILCYYYIYIYTTYIRNLS